MKKIILLSLVIISFWGCEKEDVKTDVKYDITYKVTMYSSALNENARCYVKYKIDRTDYLSDTIWVDDYIQEWKYEMNKPYALFTPKYEVYSRTYHQGFDSAVFEIFLADTLYFKYSN